MRGSERDFRASFLCDKKWEIVPISLILCDFNGILTGQNIEKIGSLNIINRVSDRVVCNFLLERCAKHEATDFVIFIKNPERRNPIED